MQTTNFVRLSTQKQVRLLVYLATRIQLRTKGARAKMSEEEKKEYNLISSYLLNKYNISTGYRQGSDIYGTWYFETIIWEWDDKIKDRGKMITIEYSGKNIKTALAAHFSLINELEPKFNSITKERRN